MIYKHLHKWNFFITIETYLKNIEKNNQQNLENIPINSRIFSLLREIIVFSLI